MATKLSDTITISKSTAGTALLLIQRELLEYALLNMSGVNWEEGRRDAMVPQLVASRTELEKAMGTTADAILNEYRATRAALEETK